MLWFIGADALPWSLLPSTWLVIAWEAKNLKGLPGIECWAAGDLPSPPSTHPPMPLTPYSISFYLLLTRSLACQGAAFLAQVQRGWDSLASWLSQPKLGCSDCIPCLYPALMLQVRQHQTPTAFLPSVLLSLLPLLGICHWGCRARHYGHQKQPLVTAFWHFFCRAMSTPSVPVGFWCHEQGFF